MREERIVYLFCGGKDISRVVKAVWKLDRCGQRPEFVAPKSACLVSLRFQYVKKTTKVTYDPNPGTAANIQNADTLNSPRPSAYWLNAPPAECATNTTLTSSLAFLLSLSSFSTCLTPATKSDAIVSLVVKYILHNPGYQLFPWPLYDIA